MQGGDEDNDDHHKILNMTGSLWNQFLSRVCVAGLQDRVAPPHIGSHPEYDENMESVLE